MLLRPQVPQPIDSENGSAVVEAAAGGDSMRLVDDHARTPAASGRARGARSLRARVQADRMAGALVA